MSWMSPSILGRTMYFTTKSTDSEAKLVFLGRREERETQADVE